MVPKYAESRTVMRLRKTTNLIGLILFWGWNVLSVFLSVFLMGIAVLPYVADSRETDR